MKKRLLVSLLVLGLVCMLVPAGYSADTTVVKYAHWNALSEEYNYVKAFEEKYPDIKIEFTLIPEAEYSQKLTTMIMAGTAPDVMCLWECDISRFANGGFVIPLDDYVSQSEAFTLDDFIPAVQGLIEMQGNLYGLPWCFATEIMYYNKDLFDKAGVSYPDENWTWEDFENAAQKLTVVENGKVEQWGCDALSFQGLWYSLIGTFGDDIVNDKGQFSMGEGAKEFLKWWYRLTNEEKVVAPPQISTSGIISTDLFVAGKAAMAFNGSWMASVYRDIQNFKWDIAPIPKGVRQYSTLHTGFFTVNSASKVQDAAWQFIEFCMGEEGQELINKAANNPSARLSILEKGYYRVQGPMGPENWDAIDKTAQFAQWGYVLLPSGLTFDIVKDFNAAILGQIGTDEVVEKAINRAKEILGEEGVASE
ncbi:MAG: multiple sugar transport system substrate-binding protein [Candidatus Atribacteria bacterium]|nr:multiple sugar transport system substrate-binding protein [Candidatus Atribacteria bacterium]